MILSWIARQCSGLDLQPAYAWINSTSFRCTAFVVVFVKMSAGSISMGTWWTLIRPLSMSSVQNHLRSFRCLVFAEYTFVETTESAPVESFPMLIFSNPLNLSSRSRSWMWQASFIQRVIATRSLSTVLKAVTDWSDETHEIGAPEKKKDVVTCRPAFVWIVGETHVCKCLKFEVPAAVDDVEFLMSFEVPQNTLRLFEVSRWGFARCPC